MKTVINICTGCNRKFVDTEKWPEDALCLDCEYGEHTGTAVADPHNVLEVR
jgi:hypothetical protein